MKKAATFLSPALSPAELSRSISIRQKTTKQLQTEDVLQLMMECGFSWRQMRKQKKFLRARNVDFFASEKAVRLESTKIITRAVYETIEVELDESPRPVRLIKNLKQYLGGRISDLKRESRLDLGIF
jgi:hypothetical protein